MMTRFKQIDGQKIEMTSNEISIRESEEALAISKIEERRTARQNAINKKATGKQKLLDLGLTEEEVKALIGV
jgi:hypothetical protein